MDNMNNLDIMVFFVVMFLSGYSAALILGPFAILYVIFIAFYLIELTKRLDDSDL